MPSEPAGFAFLVLLRDVEDATGLSRLLDDVRLPSVPTESLFLVPPVSGIDFFADERRQAEIDAWWAENVPRTYMPVYLLDHEDGLQDWVKGLDGLFYMGTKSPQIASLYRETGQKTFLSSGPLDYATVVMRDFCGAQGSHGAIFDEGEALRMAYLSADFPNNLEDPEAFGYPVPVAPVYPPQQPPQSQGQPYNDPYANQPAAPGPPVQQQGFAQPPPAWNDPWAQPPPQIDQQPSQSAPAYEQSFNYSSAASLPRPGPTQRAPAPDPATPHPFELLSTGGGVPPSSPPPPFERINPQQQAYPSPSQAEPPQEQQRDFGLPSLLAPPPSTPLSRHADPYEGRAAPGWGSDIPLPSERGEPTPWPAEPGPPPQDFRGGGESRGAREAYDPGAGRETREPFYEQGGLNRGGSRPGGRRDSGPGMDRNAPPASRKSGKGRGISLPFSNPFGGKVGRRDFIPTPDRDFARRMIERGPTIVVMGSRKGGVGKTSYAAGVAIVGGQVLDTAGHKAAIVDANIANTDAWGQMNLREGAATVREVVAALTGNRQPPEPVHAQTPALACYPESRETTEYSKTDIRRLADFLRRRYTFIVVDMSNRLPDPMAGPEAAAAAYWLEQADILVLPTTSSKTDFNGVLDYLDVRNLPPVVVPYIVPKVKKNREHEVTQAYLDEIRTRVHRIVDIPDEADKVRYAGMEGVPVEQVSPALGLAYRELTESVVAMPPRERASGV